MASVNSKRLIRLMKLFAKLKGRGMTFDELRKVMRGGK